MSEDTLATLKMLLRVSSEAYDEEVKMLAEGALADMRRVGIKAEILEADPVNPLVMNALACFVKARFGFDNPDASFFEEQYRQLTIDLMNSEANVCSEGIDD